MVVLLKTVYLVHASAAVNVCAALFLNIILLYLFIYLFIYLFCF